ncbi:MAG: hypothetical protein ACRDQ5_02910, partial [Sciscionella sp.]
KANRRGGPERMIDLVTSRAPHGFDRISDVVTHHELEAIATGYNTITNTEDTTHKHNAQPSRNH